MTDLIKQIQTKIDEAAKSYGQKDAKELFTQMEEARCFRIGAAYLMPVIEKLIENRDSLLFVIALNAKELARLDEIKENYNQELLDLLNKDNK